MKSAIQNPRTHLHRPNVPFLSLARSRDFVRNDRRSRNIVTNGSGRLVFLNVERSLNWTSTQWNANALRSGRSVHPFDFNPFHRECLENLDGHQVHIEDKKERQMTVRFDFCAERCLPLVQVMMKNYEEPHCQFQ